MEYVVTQPGTRKHRVGDVIELDDRHAKALVNKVELRANHGLSPELQADLDKIDELELTVADLREQLTEAKKPKPRGRKPKAATDGV